MALGKKTGGRKKGTPNKTTAALKDAILTAAEEALPGGKVGYLNGDYGRKKRSLAEGVGCAMNGVPVDRAKPPQ
jgi:hypothetical protein